MNISFRRITSSGGFIPEIDGLRFIAIVSVVLYHLSGFLAAKDTHAYIDSVDYSFLKIFLSHGHLGVPLFFVISGFILGVPFARMHITRAAPLSLKKYFLRRLTRLEPPYILVMTVLLFASVSVAHSISLHDGIKSYFASVVYSHNFAYPGLLPLLNCPAWSLEVEVQFYVLAPIVACMFLLKSPVLRRGLLCGALLALLGINSFYTFKYVSLVNYGQFFLVGFILADMYVTRSPLIGKNSSDPIIGGICLAAIWLFDISDFDQGYQRFLWALTQLLCISIFYYLVLFKGTFRILTWGVVTNIGGMCYSIYLIHYPLISLLGNPLLVHSFSQYSFVNISVYALLLIFAILVVSSLFFLLVERPCMDKEWYKKIFTGVRKAKPLRNPAS